MQAVILFAFCKKNKKGVFVVSYTKKNQDLQNFILYNNFFVSMNKKYMCWNIFLLGVSPDTYRSLIIAVLSAGLFWYHWKPAEQVLWNLKIFTVLLVKFMLKKTSVGGFL